MHANDLLLQESEWECEWVGESERLRGRRESSRRVGIIAAQKKKKGFVEDLRIFHIWMRMKILSERFPFILFLFFFLISYSPALFSLLFRYSIDVMFLSEIDLRASQNQPVISIEYVRNIIGWSNGAARKGAIVYITIHNNRKGCSGGVEGNTTWAITLDPSESVRNIYDMTTHSVCVYVSMSISEMSIHGWYRNSIAVAIWFAAIFTWHLFDGRIDSKLIAIQYCIYYCDWHYVASGFFCVHIYIRIYSIIDYRNSE